MAKQRRNYDTDAFRGRGARDNSESRFISQRFEVYGAEAGNSSFDLVVYKHGVLLRIEVKGEAKAPRTGPVSCMKTRTGVKGSEACLKFDVLAVVDGDSVRYLRSLFHEFNLASKELVGDETPSKKTAHKYLRLRDQLMKDVLQ